MKDSLEEANKAAETHKQEAQSSKEALEKAAAEKEQLAASGSASEAAVNAKQEEINRLQAAHDKAIADQQKLEEAAKEAEQKLQEHICKRTLASQNPQALRYEVNKRLLSCGYLAKTRKSCATVVKQKGAVCERHVEIPTTQVGGAVDAAELADIAADGARRCGTAKCSARP